MSASFGLRTEGTSNFPNSINSQLNPKILHQRCPVDWNSRLLTETDFDLTCDLAGIRVFETTMRPRGLYLVYEGTPIIFVNRRLRGWRRLHVRWHEFGHHLMHSPAIRTLLDFEPKAEFQANVFAACALIPFPTLANIGIDGVAGDYPAELLAFRWAVWERLKL